MASLFRLGMCQLMVGVDKAANLASAGAAIDAACANGANVEPDRLYTYEPDRGVLELKGPSSSGPILPGGVLLAIARDDYRDGSVQQHSKALMRILINHRLGRQSLNSRQIFRDLQDL